MHTLKVTTKPNGAFRCWLEVGRYVLDKFGDRVCDPSGDRYPNKDKRLELKRKYEGSGNCTKIQWTILVPDDYHLTILRKDLVFLCVNT